MRKWEDIAGHEAGLWPMGARAAVSVLLRRESDLMEALARLEREVGELRDIRDKSQSLARSASGMRMRGRVHQQKAPRPALRIPPNDARSG